MSDVQNKIKNCEVEKLEPDNVETLGIDNANVMDVGQILKEKCFYGAADYIIMIDMGGKLHEVETTIDFNHTQKAVIFKVR